MGGEEACRLVEGAVPTLADHSTIGMEEEEEEEEEEDVVLTARPIACVCVFSSDGYMCVSFN